MARARNTKVEQIDIDTGETIETYDTIGEAAEDNWMCRNYLSKKLNEGNGVAWFTNKKMLFWMDTNKAI